jgi:serine/threonine protein kinase
MHSRIIDGKYEIVRELSKGGMGAVYEARHLRTGRKVALKLILVEGVARKTPSDALRRFEREARAAGSIESRHVVSVLDTGVDASTAEHYIVMELLSGEDLRQLIRRAGALPAPLALSIAAQVCVGLRRAHALGIIHRDIKPGNIYLARQEDGRVEVKILDFGIAKLRVDPLASNDGHDLTRSGSVLGSPLYMSPEQATGSRDVDVRSDIWSLGIVMYEALTGAAPHAHRALGAVILAICSEPARPLREQASWVSPEVAAVVHRALALEPGQRFASAKEMQAAIEALLPDGSAIHESMLRALPEGAQSKASSESPEAVSAPPVKPPAQTTVDAFTLRTGASPSSRATPRSATRLAALAGAVAVTVGVGLWGYRAGMPAAEVAHAASAVPAAASEPSAPPAAPAAQRVEIAPLTGKSEDSSQHGVPSAAPPTVSARRSAAPKSPAIRPPPQSSVVGPLPANTSTAAPAEPARRSEPEIDRRFD